LRVGLHRVVLTLVFEWNFGHSVIGRSWESIAAEYNLSHGGLLLVGLAIFCNDAVDRLVTTPGVRE